MSQLLPEIQCVTAIYNEDLLCVQDDDGSQLVAVARDEKHMAETFKEIVTNQVEIPQIKLYFTTDLRQNEETLANTLVEFKLVNGKYKMENIELKLLGM